MQEKKNRRRDANGTKTGRTIPLRSCVSAETGFLIKRPAASIRSDCGCSAGFLLRRPDIGGLTGCVGQGELNVHLYRTGVAQGWGEEDISAIAMVLERLSPSA